MKTIWKYPLEITDTQNVTMRRDARILSIQVQGDETWMWCLVDPDEKSCERTIGIYGTGHDVEDWVSKHGKFIDTIQLHGGSLIFHVFDVGEVHNLI